MPMDSLAPDCERNSLAPPAGWRDPGERQGQHSEPHADALSRALRPSRKPKSLLLCQVDQSSRNTTSEKPLVLGMLDSDVSSRFIGTLGS